MFGLIASLIVVGVTAAAGIAAFICDELSENEREEQAKIKNTSCPLKLRS